MSYNKVIYDRTVELAKLISDLVELQTSKLAEADSELGKWLARIYDDQLLTNAEFTALRDEADRRVNDVKSQYPESVDLASFQQAADDAVQLMQTGILHFKKKKLSAEAKTAVQESYAFQVAYIKACLDRFTQAF